MYINVGSSGDALNLSNLLKDGDWMVLYYAEWCGHCQTMKPEWNKVVKKLKKNNNNVNIAEIESNHIDTLINKPKIQGFPTIKMYNNGKEIANLRRDSHIELREYRLEHLLRKWLRMGRYTSINDTHLKNESTRNVYTEEA